MALHVKGFCSITALFDPSRTSAFAKQRLLQLSSQDAARYGRCEFKPQDFCGRGCLQESDQKQRDAQFQSSSTTDDTEDKSAIYKGALEMVRPDVVRRVRLCALQRSSSRTTSNQSLWQHKSSCHFLEPTGVHRVRLVAVLTLVVVDRASKATQGSFWSTGAGSDNAEVSERTRHQRANIDLLPLRFKDKEFEEEYVFNSNRLWAWRNVCLFVFKVIALTCVYGITAATGESTANLSVPSVFVNGLNAVYGLLMGLAVVCFVLPFIPYVKHRLEFATYVLLIVEALILAVFLVYEKRTIYSDNHGSLDRHLLGQEISTGEGLCVKSASSTLLILSMELIMDSWLQFFMYFFIITVSIMLPSRVRIASCVELTVLLIYATPIFTGQAYCRILLYPELLRMLHGFILLTSAIAGAYAGETKRRGLFYGWLTMKRQMRALNSERDKASQDNIHSGVSALQSHFKEIEVALMVAKTAPEGTDISSQVEDVVAHISACLEIMTDSKNLYHTELQKDLQEKTFIKALNMGRADGKGLLAANAGGNNREPLPVSPAGNGNADLASSSFTRKENVVNCFLLACCLFAKDIVDPRQNILLSRLPFFLNEIAPCVGIDTTFDVLAFHRQVQAQNPRSSAFFECGYALLRRHTSKWGCDDSVLRAFLSEMEGLYHDIPYHNSTHSAMARDFFYLFLHLAPTALAVHGLVQALLLLAVTSHGVCLFILNSLGAASVLVAALCHDVGHPGRNNAFFLAHRSPLSILYNDRAVLENFNSALTFKVLSQESCNIFRPLPKAEVMEIRAHIISLVLATDMKTHFSALTRFRASRQSPSFDHRSKREDTWLVAEMCLRAADIGHSISPWEPHFEWRCRVTAEFYLQGDEEARLGRGVSPLCDRDLHNSMARSQVGFLAHIVKPLFAEFNAAECMQGAFREAEIAIETNIFGWQQLHDSGTDVAFPPVVIAYEEKLKGKDHELDISILTDYRLGEILWAAARFAVLQLQLCLLQKWQRSVPSARARCGDEQQRAE
ncbi:hypothetical protein Efla_005171 [Eimeria flavescens]